MKDQPILTLKRKPAVRYTTKPKEKTFKADPKKMATPTGKNLLPSIKLIKRIKEDHQIKIPNQLKVYRLVFETIQSRLIQGYPTQVLDFGVFSVRQYHRPPNNRLERPLKRLTEPVFVPILKIDSDVKTLSTFAIQNPAQSGTIINALADRSKKKRMLFPKPLMVKIFETSGVKPYFAVQAMDLLFQGILQSIFENKVFSVPAFGLFSPCRRPAHLEGNPQLSKKLKNKPDLIIPRFLPVASLQEAITQSLRVKQGKDAPALS